VTANTNAGPDLFWGQYSLPFASYCTAREEVRGAIKIAERQLQRIYR